MALALGTFCVSVPVTRTRLDRNAQAVGGDLRHLGVQALAHFGAAVVHADRAVLVDVDQRAALVEHGRREADAELERHQRQAAPAVACSGR